MDPRETLSTKTKKKTLIEEIEEEEEEDLHAKQPDEQAMVKEFLRAQRNNPRPNFSKVLMREDYEMDNKPPAKPRIQAKTSGPLMYEILTYAVFCGFAAYGAYTLVTSGEQEELANAKIILSKQYAEADSEWSAPDNLTTDPRKVKEIWREPGPFGVERVVYEGPGESWSVSYGDNRTAI